MTVAASSSQLGRHQLGRHQLGRHLLGGHLLGGHLWHVVIFGSWAPLFLLALAVERWRARPSRAPHPPPPAAVPADRPGRRLPVRGTTARQVLATGLTCAAVVHLFVMPDHFAQSALYGAFFLVAATLQLAGAAAVLARPSRATINAVVAATALIVAGWLYTRVVGVPIGPDHGATEPVGVLDLVATASELLACLAGLLARNDPAPAPTWRWGAWAPRMRLATTSWLALTLVAGVLASKS